MATFDELTDLILEKDDPTIASLPRDDLDFLVEDGDLAIVQGINVIKDALIRRLRTPLGQYGVLIGGYDDEGQKVIIRHGVGYGSDAGRMISEPLTNTWIRSFVELITATLGEEDRIRLVDVDVDIYDPARGMVRFTIKYEIADSGDVENLTLETAPGILIVGG